MGKEFDELPVETRISKRFEFIHEACEVATDCLDELVDMLESQEKDFLETKEGYVPARFHILRNAIGSAFIAVESLNEYAIEQIWDPSKDVDRDGIINPKYKIT